MEGVDRSQFEKLPCLTDGLKRLMELSEGNGTNFIITTCRKAGFVYGNHTVEYDYEADGVLSRLKRFVDGHGEVIHGTVTLREGKIAPPISQDALVTFGREEFLFPIGYYIHNIQQLCDESSNK